MVKRNSSFNNMTPNYLFPEIQKRVRTFQKTRAKRTLISLGIGDTSEPLPKMVAQALSEKAHGLCTDEGYEGYGSELGNETLRERISQVVYKGMIPPSDIFISDGAKCDIGRLQTLFGSETTISVQDPTYPVYVDSSLLLNQKKVHPLPCTPENHFFPPLVKSDLIFFCSPNNPTGVAATHEELTALVRFAKEQGSIIIYDAAYSPFISNGKYPRSIYEIEGAKEVAIEVSSFSKTIGFTGVRLGWSVVPHSLCYDDGSHVQADWKRVLSTLFNGPSNISQAGGIAALSHKGQEQITKLIEYYMENAALLKKALEKRHVPIYGGEQSPYLWVDFGEKDSWAMFDTLLEKTHLITTPGVGFGSSGQGFIRFSAFGKRDQILEACQRLETL